MMYNTDDLQANINGAQRAAEPITQDVMVYIDSEPDYVGADFLIDRHDKKGIALFREFAAKMAEHYKSISL